MLVVWVRARAELRRRWAGTLVIIVLLGLVGSVVIGAAAGARRTSTAPQRLVEAIGGYRDATILDTVGVDGNAIAALPQVEGSASITFFGAKALEPSGTVIAFAASDPLSEGLLVEGAAPDLDDPLAAVIDEPAARRFGVGVGDRIVLGTFRPDQFATGDLAEPNGRSFDIHVAAVIRQPDDIAADDPSGQAQVSYYSPAAIYLPMSFLDRYGEQVATVTTQVGYELTDGPGGAAAFRSAVRELPGGDRVQFFTEPPVDPTTQRTVDVQSFALVLFAVVLGVAGALTIGQTLSRQLRADGEDEHEALRAMGFTRAQRVGVTAVRGVVVGLAGSVVAAAIAVAWSPLTPVGLARQVEPDPGVSVNVAVVALGAVAMALLIAGRAVFTGWSLARGRIGTARGWTLPFAEQAARRGATTPLVVGLALAGTSRRTGTSARSILVTAAVGLAVAIAAAGFVASFDHAAAEPRRYGWSFDAVAGNPFTGDAAALQASLEGTPGVERTAQTGNVAVQAGDEEFSIIGVEAERGIPVATVQHGTAPLGRGEIAIAQRTLDDLGKQVGDTVEVDGGSGPVELTITGIAIVPEIAAAGSGYGEGGMVTLETLAEVAPEVPPVAVLLDLAPDLDASTLAQVRDASGGLLLQPVLPNSLYDIQRIRGLPVLLSALLVAFAVAALVHNLVGLVRRRRHDLAVLKALGFAPRQIGASLVWLGAVLVAVALVVAVPVGVAFGRSVWLLLADQLGVDSSPATSVTFIVLLAPLAVLVAAVAAALPGWHAARTRPADALRTT